MNRRRRTRRRPAGYGGKKIQVNFAPIIVIICLSICAGYLTAKYVVYPILGYEPAGLNILQPKTDKQATKETKETESTASTESTAATTESTEKPTTTVPTSIIEDKVNVKKTAGYALQFGSYSTKAAADKSLKQLKSSGIKAEIVKKDDSYKVIGQIFDTKAKAKAALAKMDESVGAFVTAVEK